MSSAFTRLLVEILSAKTVTLDSSPLTNSRRLYGTMTRIRGRRREVLPPDEEGMTCSESAGAPKEAV